jgi:hypothetical protein
MLAYHPALDPYHTALRLLRLVYFNPKTYEIDTLKMLDFFLVFPGEVASVRLPQGQISWRKRVVESQNTYWFSGDRLLTFTQMRVIQETAFALLASRGVIHHQLYLDGYISLELDNVPNELRELIQAKNTHEQTLMTFLTTVLGEMPLRGKDGLKDRTKLLEFRYDAV